MMMDLSALARHQPVAVERNQARDEFVCPSSLASWEPSARVFEDGDPDSRPFAERALEAGSPRGSR